MSLVENGSNGGNMVMPVGPMMGGSGGFGNGFGYGDGGLFWIFILFLFTMMGGWGNGFGGYGGGGMMPYMMNNTTNNDVQRGFDQQSIMSGLSGIQSSLSSAEVARCQLGNNVINAMNTGFNGIQQSLSNGQLTQMQNANNIAMSLQNCCCENRAGLADLKYNLATEACADRQAINDGVRDLMAANAANFNNLLTTINGGIQSIHDKLCQQEIDALKTQNANLQTQLNLANLKGSQDAQTAQILAGQAAQAQAIEQYVNPTARPAYIVQNPKCCPGQNYSCGGTY